MAEEETNTGSSPASFADRVVGPKETPTIDISKHVGKKVAISGVEEREGQYGPFVRVVTEVVETIQGNEGPIELRGSRIFSLSEDDDGAISWAKGGHFDTFLNKMGVTGTNYNDLVGMEVQLVPITRKKDGREYLTFA